MLTKNTTTKTPDKPNASWGCSEKETVWFRPPRMIIQHAYYASTLNKTNLKNIKDFFFTQINV